MNDHGPAPSVPPREGFDHYSAENDFSTEPPSEMIFSSNQKHQGVPGNSPLPSPGSPYPPASPYQPSSPYPGPPAQPPRFSYPPPSPYLDPTTTSYPPTYSQRSPHPSNEAPNREYQAAHFQSMSSEEARFTAMSGERGGYSPMAGERAGYSPMAAPGVMYPQTMYPPPGHGQGYPPIQAAPQPQHPTHPTNNYPNSSLSGPRPEKYMSFMGDNPVFLTCPLCSENVTTTVNQEPGTLTWVICCLLFLLTGICCLIPFMIKGCKETIHRCPRCGLILNK